MKGRTLPRVRELKPDPVLCRAADPSRTLPRVRELKPQAYATIGYLVAVAPFPGCVN